jgi:hypothetical protein
MSSGTRLRVHLDRYTARNTFDYFIHKDLGGFPILNAPRSELPDPEKRAAA